MTVALVIRPRFDDATSYSFDWCQEVVDMLKLKGFDVIDLAEKDATRENFEEQVKTSNPQLIVFYNHGSEEGLVAQHGGEYVIDKKNDELLSGREIYTMACSWGADGGIDAWKKGAKAVWCYVQAFAFTTEAIEEFKTFANCGLKFKLEGKSWEESLQHAKEKAKELAQKLVEVGKYIASVLLQKDADALRCYTEKNPPETRCFFRKVAIKLFGAKLGWRITLKQTLGWFMFGVGYGLTWHDLWSEIISPVGNPYRIHGGYIGLIMILISFIILATEQVSQWSR